jgi:hypothetical protein
MAPAEAEAEDLDGDCHSTQDDLCLAPVDLGDFAWLVVQRHIGSSLPLLLASPGDVSPDRGLTTCVACCLQFPEDRVADPALLAWQRLVLGQQPIDLLLKLGGHHWRDVGLLPVVLGVTVPIWENSTLRNKGHMGKLGRSTPSTWRERSGAQEVSAPHSKSIDPVARNAWATHEASTLEKHQSPGSLESSGLRFPPSARGRLWLPCNSSQYLTTLPQSVGAPKMGAPTFLCRRTLLLEKRRTENAAFLAKAGKVSCTRNV